MMWSCTIHGEPIGQGRPRFARVGNHVRAYDPKRSSNWKAQAVEAVCCHWDGGPLTCPCSVTIRAVSQRPKRLMRRKDPAERILSGCKPDADNVAKAVLDALKAAGVVRDDALVCDLHVTKLYTALDEGPRVEIDLVAVS